MDGQNKEQTELLRNIWNEIKTLGSGLNRRIDSTNERLTSVEVNLGARIDRTNERLDQTNERLDQTNERLGGVERVLREFAGQHLLLTRYVRSKVEDHDDAIADLQRRVGRLEKPQPA